MVLLLEYHDVGLVLPFLPLDCIDLVHVLLFDHLPFQRVLDLLVDVAGGVDDQGETHFVLDHVAVQDGECVVGHAPVRLLFLLGLRHDVLGFEGLVLGDVDAVVGDLVDHFGG